MKTPVLILAHNNLPSLKRCLNSVCGQDANVSVFVIDNDSSDDTESWLSSDEYTGIWQRFSPQLGVSGGWNYGLNKLFYDPIWNASCVLCLNSDTIIPPWFLRELASSGYLYDKAEFVTGSETNKLEELDTIRDFQQPHPSPDFSCFLIGRSVWEKVGQFDETMKNWCSDLDYHYRAHRLGINLWRSGVIYYHERSTTIRNAPPKERRALEMQADSDRLTLFEKWGAHAGPEFHALFTPSTFGIANK